MSVHFPKKLMQKIDVDVFGFTSGNTGWATHSTGFSSALNELITVNFRTDRRAAVRGLLGPDRLPLFRGLFKAPGDFGVIVQGMPFPSQPSARWIVWETTIMPEAQRQLCSTTQFLWTPSEWGRNNLMANGIEADRVSVVPEGVDINFFRPGNRKPGRFRFLMVGKWENRKFCEGLLQAFTEEFKSTETVELCLHAHNPYVADFSLKTKVQEAGFQNVGNIILSGPCNREVLRELYQSADCFVMPTRAEGWGLPILESMACGVPAITTRYSAQVDYVNDQNGYLINVGRMVEAHDDDFQIHTGLWAEPDIAHLRHLMRTAFEDRCQLSEKGLKARQTAEQFTWQHSATVALQAINRHLSK